MGLGRFDKKPLGSRAGPVNSLLTGIIVSSSSELGPLGTDPEESRSANFAIECRIICTQISPRGNPFWGLATRLIDPAFHFQHKLALRFDVSI